jgi:hypothetical protein
MGERLRQQPTIGTQHHLVVPHALVDELLQRLFGIAVPARRANASTQWLDALALAIQQQSL